MTRGLVHVALATLGMVLLADALLSAGDTSGPIPQSPVRLLLEPEAARYRATLLPAPPPIDLRLVLSDAVEADDPLSPTPTPAPAMPTQLDVSGAAHTQLDVSVPGVPAIEPAAAAALLRDAGLPEHAIPAALHIIGRESSFHPASVGFTCARRCLGLFQLDEGTWPRYCAMSPDELLTAVGNIRCAVRVYWYDVNTGGPEWRQWPNTRP